MTMMTVVLAAAAVIAVPSGTPVHWAECAPQTGTECATLRLPIDWGDPDGPTFPFEVARHRATADRIGTLVFAPGGPGDSGVGFVKSLSRFSAEQIRRFDIVSFDPRGVGLSQAMPCAVPETPVITSEQGFDDRIRDNRAAWAACREKYGELWEHADTASTVRDIDALRAALGERQITLHGSSYGTLAGELYAERYPRRLRAMVLESAFDHSLGTRGFLRTQAWALQDSFDAFVAWCDANEACALHGQDVHAAWAGLPGDRWDLTATAHYLLYTPRYEQLADWIKNPVGTVHVPTPAIPVVCNDVSLPVRDYAQYRRELDRAATRDFSYSAGVLAIGYCLGWPQPVANPQHRLHVHTRAPILQVNSLHDPATGYNWALSVAAQLGRSGVLLTYGGAGHGSADTTPCMRDTTDAYLTELRLPQRGTVCPG